MGDPRHGGLKAFLFVGIAYIVVAVAGPLVLLLIRGASWSFPTKGIVWSLLAGTVGAIGAFGVVLAFGAKGMPSVVMSIIFAGAPVVNAILALSLHPPLGGWGSLRWQFILGIALAAIGGSLVTFYRPPPGPVIGPTIQNIASHQPK